MIRLALLLVFAPIVGWAVPMSECPGGGWVPTANFPAWCPNDITTISTAPTDTGATISVTSTAASGTTYVSIRTTATEVHWRTIVNGTGDEASASASQSATTTAIAVTGLTDSTEYVAHVVNVLDNKPSSYEIATFTTSAGGGSGDAIAGGDDWFFCPDGSDAASGLSHANRKANYPQTDTSMLGESDDMWLCSGGIWTSRTLDIARTGTALDLSEMGTYYMDGSTARKAVDGVRGSGTTHTKAELRGGLTEACVSAGTCTFPSTGFPYDGGLTGTYDAHVHLYATADYHDMRNIKIRLTRWSAVHAYGTGSADSLTNLTFDGIDVSEYSRHAVFVGSGVTDAVVRNGDWSQGGLCQSFRFRGTSSNVSGCSDGVWQGAFATTSATRRVLVENNDIREHWGEGIGCFYMRTASAGRLVIRGNRVVNTLSSPIYIDGCAYNVIENNIIVGGNGNINGYQIGHPLTGISISSELSSSVNSVGNVVRNNLVVGARWNIFGGLDDAAAGDTFGAKVYGNTSIAPRDTTSPSGEVFTFVTADGGSAMAEWDFRNNAAWDDVFTTSQCYMIASANLTKGYNAWSHNPSDSDCDGTGDVIGSLSLTDGTWANWTTVRNQSGESMDWPTFAEVNPAGGSAIIGAGVALTSAILDKDDYGVAFTQIAEVLTGTYTEAEFECALCIDALGATRASPPSMGAVE